MKDYPKMILTTFEITDGFGILKSGVCIKECPTEKGKDLKDGEDCKSNKEIACDKHKTYVTKDVFDFCLPASADALSENEKKGYEALMSALHDSAAGTVFQDMYKSSTSMYASMGLALVWSIVYIYLMSCFAEQLAWCCVVLIQVGLLAGTAFAYLQWEQAKKFVADK